MAEIKIGPYFKKKGEAHVKKVLTKRYPGKTKEIEACLAENFPKEDDKKNPDGNTERSTSKSPSPKK